MLAALVTLAGGIARAAQVEAPTPVTEVPGVWPGEQAGRQDVIVPVIATIARDGTVSEVAIEVSREPALDAAALTAARGWRFLPARRDGEPIEAKIRLAIRFSGVAPAAVAAAPAPAAQEARSEPPLDVRVLGERPPRSASEVTRDRAVLQAAPHRSADELLAVVPGVFITQHSGEGKAYQIFYRGFDAVHGQDVEIWAGGAPVNDVSNLHGQGYADLHFLPAEIVRTLHATPGTYDPRQGDFAVAGTLRLELGYDQPGFTAKAGLGSFDARRFFLGYRPPRASDETFAAVELYDTHGFGPSRAAQRASAIAQVVLPLGPETELRLLASGHAGHFASAGVVRLADVEAGRIDRFATYDPTQGGDSGRSQLVAEVRRQDDDSGFSLSSYLVLRSLRLRHNFTGYLGDANGDSQQQLNQDLLVGANGFYRQRLRLLSALDQIEVGFSTRTDWIEQSQKRLAIADARVTGSEVDAKVRASAVAGYLDLALHPLPRLVLRGGVRLDGLAYSTQDLGDQASGQARSSQGRHIGKKLSADLRLFSGLHGIASYGEGFRSPQARSLAEGETTPFTSVRSAEVGLRLGTPTLTASLAAFQTWLSDDLVFDQGTTRNERVPATQRRGITADLRLAPRPWFTATTSATFTRAMFRGSDDQRRAGDLVPYAPQIVLRSDVSFTPTLGNWAGRPVQARLGAGLSWLGRRPLPYGEWGHDVALLDASAALRVGGVELGLELFNALDAQWYDGEFVYASRWNPEQGAALVPQRHVTVGAPRSLMATAALYF